MIISIGYLVGRIRIKGVGLGISAILLIALLAGHFGVTVPGIIKNIFVVPLALGLLAGALSSTPCLATGLEIT